jgi:hypothetical protein
LSLSSRLTGFPNFATPALVHASGKYGIDEDSNTEKNPVRSRGCGVIRILSPDQNEHLILRSALIITKLLQELLNRQIHTMYNVIGFHLPNRRLIKDAFPSQIISERHNFPERSHIGGYREQ